MAETSIQLARGVDEAVLPFAVSLELNVNDPELVRELMVHPEGRPRDEYALCALKIGLVALKQARGQLDGDTIKQEGERLLAALDGKLSQHSRGLNDQLTGVLKDYFDPESGRFQERIQRLVKKDGELEAVLRRQVGDHDSELCKTLTAHFGNESPLMKLLSPTESEGLLKSLSETLSEALMNQRSHVLAQFSLDNPDGALSRLVQKLTENHGDLGKNLQLKIDEVVKEFSLDNEHSALSRMSLHLKTTSEAIDNHLTLDKETSALSRLKRELLDLLNKHSETSQKFQEEVKRALDEMRVRREEAQRSPVHGKQFEKMVHDFVQNDCQRAGDVVTFTGDTVGAIKNCKVGDTVIELSPDCLAGGAKIVVEAKDKIGYKLDQARLEIEQGRTNRGACVGLFVFARATAPEGLEPLQRLGDDLFVVWNPDDPQSDIYLRAGLMAARALCARQAKQRQDCTADFDGIDRAINDIEKKADSLDEIRTSAESISSGADKILKRVELARKGIESQVAALRDLMSGLKDNLRDSGTVNA